MVGIKGNKKHTQTNKSVSKTDFQKHCLYLILQGREKGLSLHNTLYNIGQELNANIPPDHSDKIRQLQDKNGFNLQTYINSYISGDAVKDNGIASEDFNACQARLE